MLTGGYKMMFYSIGMQFSFVNIIYQSRKIITMAGKERITQPSSGSNELGSETQETHPKTGISAGTDTQLHLAALSGKKHKKIRILMMMKKL
jgi:hypothetical protein